MMSMDINIQLINFYFVPLAFFVVFLIALRPKITKISKLPPGPLKLPLIGNLHQCLGSIPHRTFLQLAKKHGPVMHLKFGEISTIVVSSPKAAEMFLKNYDLNFAQKRQNLFAKLAFYGGKDIIFCPYGDAWRQMRKVCAMKLLSQKRVQSFRSIREEEVSDMIKKMSMLSSSRVNLSEMIFSVSYGIVTRVAFGMKNNYDREFRAMVIESERSMSGFTLADMYPSIPFLERITGMKAKMTKLSGKVDRLLQNALNEYKSRATEKRSCGVQEDVFADVLLNLQKSNELDFPLTDSHIKGIILDVFAAGTETSSTTVVWAMSEMLKNPSIMKKAQAEVRQVFKEQGNVDETGLQDLIYLKAVIKETLRLHPPVTLLRRECRVSCEIDGNYIAAKTLLVINLWAIGRDLEHWSEAERFCPERFLDNNNVTYMGTNFEYLPFGSGRRMCPGMSFAMPDMELPLAQLLYHFDWKLPGGIKNEELDMIEEFGITTRRKNDLVLVPIPYLKNECA